VLGIGLWPEGFVEVNEIGGSSDFQVVFRDDELAGVDFGVEFSGDDAGKFFDVLGEGEFDLLRAGAVGIGGREAVFVFGVVSGAGGPEVDDGLAGLVVVEGFLKGGDDDLKAGASDNAVFGAGGEDSADAEGKIEATVLGLGEHFFKLTVADYDGLVHFLAPFKWLVMGRPREARRYMFLILALKERWLW
jgi:hypothetical protein